MDGDTSCVMGEDNEFYSFKMPMEMEENHAGGHHAQVDRLLRLLPLPPAVEVEVEVEEILFVKPLVNLAVELVLARESLQTEAAFCKGMLTRLQLQFPTLES